jgi:hypothetical protein
MAQHESTHTTAVRSGPKSLGGPLGWARREGEGEIHTQAIITIMCAQIEQASKMTTSDPKRAYWNDKQQRGCMNNNTEAENGHHTLPRHVFDILSDPRKENVLTPALAVAPSRHMNRIELPLDTMCHATRGAYDTRCDRAGT